MRGGGGEAGIRFPLERVLLATGEEVGLGAWRREEVTLRTWLQEVRGIGAGEGRRVCLSGTSERSEGGFPVSDSREGASMSMGRATWSGSAGVAIGGFGAGGELRASAAIVSEGWARGG